MAASDHHLPASLCCLVAFVFVFLLPVPAAGQDASPNELATASAHWLQRDVLAWDVPKGNRVELHHSPSAALSRSKAGLAGGKSVNLKPAGQVDGDLAQRFPHLTGMPLFELPASHRQHIPGMLKSQLVLLARDDEGLVSDFSAVQLAGVLDHLFAHDNELGVTFDIGVPSLHLWAPTARAVRLLLFDDPGQQQPSQILDMQDDPVTGTWSLRGEADWNRKYYLYEVEVFVRSTGRIEINRVSDPYAHSLSMNSRHAQIVDLSDADLLPEGWATLSKPAFSAPEDIVLYELHVRDFSIADRTVPEEHRGKFSAFTETQSDGMRHLRSLAAAGLSHLHLLPAFDCATIPENPRDQQSPPDLTGYAADSPRQQEEIDAVRAGDAFNWCYDPYHYTVPEGSYSTDPDGVTRIREYREMVAALNRNGLRVVMDVVYNHTTTSGQSPTSVLDRIVPDYYQRLDGSGNVEISTCCSNTATEHRMMEKLMLDSLLTWAVQYKVDAFRFDLMGHHTKANMLKVRNALQSLTLEQHGVDGSSIYLYGEGWNFGEVADDSRFVQATQKHMGRQTGIGTFNDRLRDAVRGGEHDDKGIRHVQTQGFVNGLYYAPNRENSGSEQEKERLLHMADLVRVGLAGSLAAYTFENRHGKRVKASEVDYHGQPAGYTSDPQEAINYVAAHDNETLFDINQYKLPLETSMANRVRVINLANSVVALAQGVPFFHAGQDMLRSKSLDRNSFDSGDWFNLLDFSFEANGWARGLPPKWDNEANWTVAAPLLAEPRMAPGSEHIQASVVHLREMLEIRHSIPLFRQRDADGIQNSLRFHNTGPGQVPGLIAMSIDDGSTPGAVVLFNATPSEQVYRLDLGRRYQLHPVMQQSADTVVRKARFEASGSRFHVPARTTAVFISQ